MLNLYILTIVVLIIFALLAWVLLKKQRKLGLNSPSTQTSMASKQTEDWIIYYASQRGRAKNIAEQTAQALEANGKKVTIIKLASIKPHDLAGKTHCLFITSTFGNGQAPEAARGFERKLKKNKIHLNNMNFAVLALGDQQYDRFCGFGKKLNRWLIQNQANPINPIITVSQMNTQSIQEWHNFITTLKKMNLSGTRTEQTSSAIN